MVRVVDARSETPRAGDPETPVAPSVPVSEVRRQFDRAAAEAAAEAAREEEENRLENVA